MNADSFAQVWDDYQQAKDRLIAFFRPRIIGLARKHLWDKALQEDVTQSVLLSIIENHAREVVCLPKPDALWDLFAGITSRHCDKHNKRLARAGRRGPVVRVRGGGSSGGFEPPADELPPDVQAAVADLFDECKKKLAGRQKQVLVCLLEGMDRKAIAGALQVSIPTVDRELKKVKEVLTQLGGETIAEE